MALTHDDPRVLKAVRAASDKIAKPTPRQHKEMMRILLSFDDLPKPSLIIKRIIEHVAPEKRVRREFAESIRAASDTAENSNP